MSFEFVIKEVLYLKYCKILLIIFLLTTPAYSEVRSIDPNTIQMTSDDYKFFITQIQILTTERDILRKVLEEERSSLDVLIDHIESLNDSLDKERSQYDQYIKTISNKRYLPGIIGGIGVQHNGYAGWFIGLGWKFDIF